MIVTESHLRLKLVVVGDGATGKTSLLARYAQGTFVDDYVPTIFENQVKQIEVSNSFVNNFKGHLSIFIL